MTTEILKAHKTMETKSAAFDALRDALYHFDVDMYLEGHGTRAAYHVRLWQEGDDKGEVEAPTLSEALVLAAEEAKRLVFPFSEPEQEVKISGLNIVADQLSPMELGRLNKALDRVFRFKIGTMTLRAYLQRLTFHRKSQKARYYSKKRRNLEYALLARPKTEHTLWYLNDGIEFGIDVPKLVYDALPDILEITFEQWHSAQTEKGEEPCS